ncbi:MAG: class I SAM-dependent methyltransferase [Pirellulales bacterium]|nr:class I SAM-dependent methyltransferase [Pirellulales bacterium]
MPHVHKGKSSERVLDKNRILAALEGEIVPGRVIWDAGCGNGYMAKEFAGRMDGRGRIYAMDIDEEAIGVLRQETQGTILEASVGDVTRETPIEAGSVDLVYSCTVFHGFSKEQIAGFRAEVARVLKPGGRLGVVEIQKGELRFGPPTEIRFSPEELQAAVGLPCLATIEIGPSFYLQLFERA